MTLRYKYIYIYFESHNQPKKKYRITIKKTEIIFLSNFSNLQKINTIIT